MINLNDEITLKIDTLSHGAEGIGRYEGMSIFVEDVCPEDVVKVKITQVKKNFARAILLEILEPSSNRVKPFCPMTKVCGGCQWQHVNYKTQLKYKQKAVEDTLKKIAGIDIPVKEIIASPITEKYRCKVQYPVRQTRVSKRILAGYFKKGTHEVVNIKYCPIQPRIIDKTTEDIREMAAEHNLSAYDEKKHKGLIRHIVYRFSQSENNLNLILVVNDEKVSPQLKKFCESIKETKPHIKGVSVNFNNKRTNVIMGAKTQNVVGDDFIIENLDGNIYKISSGSFFQVNPPAAVNIFNAVKKIIVEKVQNPRILDAYSGVGSFSIWLRDIASEIYAVEEYPQAVLDAKENITLNKADNIKIFEGDAKLIFRELKDKGEKFDVVVIDPPRKGCDEEAIDALESLSDKYIIYVSCNPATLARDIKLLSDKGFDCEFVQPVDMFCHTYHIESIALIKKTDSDERQRNIKKS